MENDLIMAKQQEHMTSIMANICNLFKSTNSMHATDLKKFEGTIQTVKNHITATNKRLNNTIEYNGRSKEVSNVKRSRIQKSWFFKNYFNKKFFF